MNATHRVAKGAKAKPAVHLVCALIIAAALNVPGVAAEATTAIPSPSGQPNATATPVLSSTVTPQATSPIPTPSSEPNATETPVPSSTPTLQASNPIPSPSSVPNATATPPTESTATPLMEIGPIEGHGTWQVNPIPAERQRPGAQYLPDGPANSKKWHAHLTRHGDKSVTGDISVEVGNQWLITHGEVHGRAERGRIWGDILDDDGNQAATFEAGLGAGVVEGNFTTSEGQTGSMSWDGVLPTPPPGITWGAMPATPAPTVQ